MTDVVLFVVTVYQEIVKVEDQNVVDDVLEYIIQQILEDSWCVSKAHRHHEKLEMTEFCFERCLFDILRHNSYLEQSGLEAEFRVEGRRLSQLVKHFVCTWYGSIFVLGD